jgi:hypothetical protein
MALSLKTMPPIAIVAQLKTMLRVTMVAQRTTMPGNAMMGQHTTMPHIAKVARRKMAIPIAKVVRHKTSPPIPLVVAEDNATYCHGGAPRTMLRITVVAWQTMTVRNAMAGQIVVSSQKKLMNMKL